MKILIAVCTYKRLKEVQRCLESIQELSLFDDILLDIIVIDNEPSDKVASLCKKLGVYYISEPQRGLVYARNAVLKCARFGKYDYCGILDDDETVSSNWLGDMLAAFKTTQADAISGIIDIKLKANMPQYLKKAYQFKKISQTMTVKTMPMGNVMLSKRAVESGIDFDAQFNFTGGEDIDFFSKLYKAGYKLFKIPNAKVTEYLTPEKASLKAYFNRQLRVAKLHYAQKYPTAFSLGFFSEIILAFLGMVSAFLMLPICLVSDRFKIKTAKLSAKSLGRLLSRSRRAIHAYGAY